MSFDRNCDIFPGKVGRIAFLPHFSNSECARRHVEIIKHILAVERTELGLIHNPVMHVC